MNHIVVAQATDEQILDRLREIARVTVITNNDEEALLAACADAVCLQVGTWVKVTEAFLDLCPMLKVVSRTGVGVDNVDIAAASRKGIMVLNTPQANSISVAEHTLALILALSKQLFVLDSHMREGDFQIRRKNLPVDLYGKTLGLIGFGNIGRMVAQKANAAFSMRVLAYDPYVEQAEPYVQLLQDYTSVVEQSDIVSIHLPLVPQTRNLFDATLLARMKKNAFLINTSRGGIVDEMDLCAALDTGTIAGAALDVFENEPPQGNSPIFQTRNLIITPHAAALTKECVVRVAETAAEGILDYLAGKDPQYIYNKQQLNWNRN